mgnify:CR=1 FL=1
MYKKDLKVRVRYSETDKMGVVYHGNFIPYFEIGRVELMRTIGLVYKDLEAEEHAKKSFNNDKRSCPAFSPIYFSLQTSKAL